MMMSTAFPLSFNSVNPDELGGEARFRYWFVTILGTFLSFLFSTGALLVDDRLKKSSAGVVVFNKDTVFVQRLLGNALDDGKFYSYQEVDFIQSNPLDNAKRLLELNLKHESPITLGTFEPDHADAICTFLLAEANLNTKRDVK